MSKSKLLDKALSIIDEHIRLDQKEIARMIYAETGYCDQDFNKFLAIITPDHLVLRDYIRKRKLYFAVRFMIDNSDKKLSDIAQEYYSDQSAFTRAVKAEYGITPAKLRTSQQEIPDIRESMENCLSNFNRLDSIFAKMDARLQMNSSDWRYFETFIYASDELGFDVSTCCLISELAEKLEVPFGYLLNQLFMIMIQADQGPVPSEVDEIEYMMDLGINNGREFEAIYKYFGCKYYEVTEQQVREYREKHNTSK